MALKDFALPDLGEGLTESELVSWRVAVGDTVTLNQVIAEVETAKALVELPSPFAGTVAKLYADEGETVAVGAPIVAFDIADSAGTDAAPAVAPDGSTVTESAVPAKPAKAEREPVLVGYGPKISGGTRPTRRARRGAPASVAGEGAADAATGAVTDTPHQPSGTEASTETSPETGTETRIEAPRSTPPVRKLARDLGVDLATVSGTGEHGLITRVDVERAASGATGTVSTEAPPRLRAVPSGADARDPDARETRIPVQGVRKHTAAAMVASAFTAPHASEFLTIDVTPTLELIETLRASSAFRGIRLNLLAVVAKAVCLAVSRTPEVNARWDEAEQQILQFHYLNLGIAAATPRGLVVPNIKDAHELDLAGMATALGELVEAAKAGKTSPQQLSGGTLSITNIGVFGIDAGTPILPPGEALILALGAVKRMPWEYRDEVALRQVLTLSISFDHRLVDGEQASRFLADVGRILANPANLLAMV